MAGDAELTLYVKLHLIILIKLDMYNQSYLAFRFHKKAKALYAKSHALSMRFVLFCPFTS